MRRHGSLYRMPLLVLLGMALPVAAAAEVEVRFSPYGGCDKALIQLAQSAEMYLDAASHSFGLAALADELIAAKRRGVRVQVLLDRSQASQEWSHAGKLRQAGIPIKVNGHAGLMHHSFLVADGKHLATGSFEWTQAGVRENDENLVVFLGEVATASAFAVQFGKLWNDATRFQDFAPEPSQARISHPSVSPPAAARPQAAPEAGSDTVYITSSGSKYHRAGCRHLSKSMIPISRAEAEAKGYTPCSVCKP